MSTELHNNPITNTYPFVTDTLMFPMHLVYNDVLACYTLSYVIRTSDNMSDFNLKFYESFRIITIALRSNKCYPYVTRDKIWFLQVIAMFTLNFGIFILLLNSIIFYDVPAREFTTAIKNGIMAIVATTITFKYCILVRDKNSIIQFIERLNEDYEIAKHLSAEERDIVSKFSAKGVFVCKIWLIIAVITSILFPLKAFYLMGLSYSRGEFQLVPMYDLNYPKIINDYKTMPILYFILFSLTFYFDLFAMTMYMGFDPLVPVFMLHLCGQIHLLSRRIQKVFTGNNTNAVINENLKQINIKLSQIYICVVSRMRFIIL
ncbi:unnamed protein product [Leptidea sinapis]|uniref:Odorant receptor n=1 Tax=Leptidea sinapis TaxID=189913 RepID=A0A5E4QV01_9NEOP|nr:unnamed protein product [Leptidea sinapis]